MEYFLNSVKEQREGIMQILNTEENVSYLQLHYFFTWKCT